MLPKDSTKWDSHISISNREKDFQKSKFYLYAFFFLTQIKYFFKAIQLFLRDFIFRHKCCPQRPLKQIIFQ